MFDKIDKTKYTPMMQQYLDIKENYQDAFVFFRLGDFYEMFFDDAINASQILEIALTGREAGAKERVPMCGVPHHSAQSYIERLIASGYKVAIVEQVEDAAVAKGIVKRDVVKLITPGTIMDEGNLKHNENNYLVAIHDFITHYGFAYTDLTTGEVFTSLLAYDIDVVIDEILSLKSKEVIISKDFSNKKFIEACEKYNIIISIENDLTIPSEFSELFESIVDQRNIAVVSKLLNYLIRTQKRSLDHIQKVKNYENEKSLVIDIHSKYNLELTETIRGKVRQGSLLWVIDKTNTAMGGRLLKKWIDKPLINPSELESRYDIVEAFQNNFIIREELKNSLKNVYDLERLVGRISYGTANARDLLQLKRSILEFPNFKRNLIELSNKQISNKINEFNECLEIGSLLENSIIENPPFTIKEGGIIKDGFNKDLDELRYASRNGKVWITELEAKERERTGIKSLKIKYNKVFGYFIEVTKANLHLIPEDSNYDRKQTLANAERFITPELKEKENLILGSEEKSIKLEYELFVQIREYIKKYLSVLQDNAKVIAEIDALISFSIVSEENHYVRPKLNIDNYIRVVKGRHPVIEHVMKEEKFVANDIFMDDSNDILLITGPNMSGKSTYMRQMALIAIMAQIGCFVPAEEACIPIFDKIFTRIGASDDLISGQSTFMVEMIEANNALKNATEKSLILFDEIGRGTATYDGMALAQAIIEYIHEKIKCKTMFSTHYHELVELEGHLKELKNVHVRAEEGEGDLVFLHQVEEGPTDKSYGVEVAKLAKLPIQVIKRAEKILSKLEARESNNTIDKDITIFDFDFVEEKSQTKEYINEEEKEIIDEIKNLDVFELTPIEAINVLYKLKNKVK